MAIISNATTIADAGAFSVGLGDQVLIKTITASNAATVSFLNGSDSVVFDGTYPFYKFVFINIHPVTDNQNFEFQVDTGTNTSFNQTMTTSVFRAYHDEDDSGTAVEINAGNDQAQGTGFQDISDGIGNGNDESGAGELLLFDPSNSTYIKHFMAQMTDYNGNNHNLNVFTAGYVNTTTALTRVRFKFGSGNIDSGTIKLYGIKGAAN